MTCCETILRTLRLIQPATSAQVELISGLKKSTVQSLLPRLAFRGRVVRKGIVRNPMNADGPRPYLWALR
jgi:predicted transcriptional regulator